MLGDCLCGVRVLDLSQYLPGPLATRMLADLGADVLKVEPPGGDPLRRVPPLNQQGTGVFYDLLVRGKTCTPLDLKSASGRKAFESLVRRADVLFEAFRPGVLANLVGGYDRLREVNPRLLYCALTGYGQNGPLRDRAGHDLNYVAHSGGLSLVGDDAGPQHPWPSPADHAAATQAALGVVAAVLRRQQTCRAAHIDISIADCYLAWQERDLATACLDLPAQGRGTGRLNGGSACYHIYRTSDGEFVTLAALEKKFWSNFCQVVGRPDWIERHDDPMPQAQLIEELARLFAGRDRAHWEDRLASADCCFQPALEHAEVVSQPQIEARRLVHRQPGFGAEVLFPVWLDGKPPPPRRPAIHLSAEAAVAMWNEPENRHGGTPAESVSGRE